MNENKTKEWILGAIGLTIGCIGAFIQSWILCGDLDHRYPFKIMNVPPPEFYVEVSKTLSSSAPYLAVFVGLLFLFALNRKKIIAGFIPLLFCPLTYIFGLWYLVSNSQYKDELQNPINFDSTTPTMRHQEFFMGSFNLFLFSAFVYLMFLALIYGIKFLTSARKMP